MLKQTVPPNTASRISEKGSMGRRAWERGDTSEAETFFLEAWNSLPEPRTEYDYAQSLSRALVTFYRDTGQFEKAKKWLEVMRKAYGPGPDDSVEFLAATVHFAAGELEAAFKIFDSQFKKFKARPFQGEDKKYLEFYKQRAAATK